MLPASLLVGPLSVRLPVARRYRQARALTKKILSGALVAFAIYLGGVLCASTCLAANYEGDVDPETGQVFRAKSTFENFMNDLLWREEKCVWRDREHLESYFLTLAGISAVTVIGLPITVIKLISYAKSRAKWDHRAAHATVGFGVGRLREHAEPLSAVKA
jgi:hypothetical protein